MGPDIRYPIGIMFSLIGGLLVFFGLITHGNPEVYRRSLGLNINLWWGLVLLAFGLFMWVMAWRASRKAVEAGSGAPTPSMPPAGGAPPQPGQPPQEGPALRPPSPSNQPGPGPGVR